MDVCGGKILTGERTEALVDNLPQTDLGGNKYSQEGQQDHGWTIHPECQTR
jgi:hypothetical protein